MIFNQNLSSLNKTVFDFLISKNKEAQNKDIEAKIENAVSKERR